MLQSAIDSLQSLGGIVRLTAGVYDLGSGSVTLHNKIQLLCEPGAVIQGTGTVQLVDASNTDHASVRGCGFVVTSTVTPPANFHVALRGDNSSNLDVGGCDFSMTVQPTPDQSQIAILTSGAKNVYVHENHARWMQFALDATPLVSEVKENVRVLNNVFDDPYNFAVSVVAARNNNPSGLRNVTLSGNVVVNVPSAGAFFIGPDGTDTELNEVSYIRVEDNTVRGTWRPGFITLGLIVSTGVTSHDWVIANNTFVNESGTTGGIGMQLFSNHDHRVDRVNISGNIVAGAAASAFDLYALDLQLNGSSIAIANNQFGNSRGIHVIATRGGISDLLITGNVVESTSHALFVIGTQLSGDATPGFRFSTVSNNMLSTAAASSFAIFRDQAGTESFDVAYLENRLRATGSGGAPWGGSNPSGEQCVGNLPSDCP
jgi:hypothetical protein